MKVIVVDGLAGFLERTILLFGGFDPFGFHISGFC